MQQREKIEIKEKKRQTRQEKKMKWYNTKRRDKMSQDKKRQDNEVRRPKCDTIERELTRRKEDASKFVPRPNWKRINENKMRRWDKKGD